jgi:hypothetical protein
MVVLLEGDVFFDPRDIDAFACIGHLLSSVWQRFTIDEYGVQDKNLER